MICFLFFMLGLIIGIILGIISEGIRGSGEIHR